MGAFGRPFPFEERIWIQMKHFGNRSRCDDEFYISMFVLDEVIASFVLRWLSILSLNEGILKYYLKLILGNVLYIPNNYLTVKL